MAHGIGAIAIEALDALFAGRHRGPAGAGEAVSARIGSVAQGVWGLQSDQRSSTSNGVFDRAQQICTHSACSSLDSTRSLCTGIPSR